MKHFPQEGRFDTDKRKHMGDLSSQSTGILGAMVSPTLSSTITESAREVFLKLKRVTHPLHILFSTQVGQSETFLYLCECDLTSPQGRAAAARLIQRHFR
jgi:hypothetical protein